MKSTKNFLFELASLHKGLLTNNVLLAIGGLSFLWLGQFCAGHQDKVFGMGHWKTYNFLGNSGRSPTFPHFMRPYVADIEARKEFESVKRLQKFEL